MRIKGTSPYVLASIGVVLVALAILLLLILNRWHDEPEGTVSLSAWVVDWEAESGMEDLERVADALHSVHIFAVYYDERDALLQPEDMDALRQQVRAAVQPSSSAELYLTVVNDIWRADGTAVQKDADLITRIVHADEDARRAHHKQLADAVERFGGFAGLEIDYERVKEEDWPAYLAWIQELYEELQERGHKLRIVLEPRAPLADVSLPEGPEYVMMAYNLHGYHSGPGPKANEALLRRLAASMNSATAGDPIIALATGGFDWEDGAGEIRALTEQEAVRLAEEYEVKPLRDRPSGARYFTYIDDAGRLHTVWYADTETLARWIHILREEGISRIALWRLGGFHPTTLQFIREQAATESGNR